MYDTITTALTLYEQACSQCIDDLYHTAYLVLVDADAAEKLMETACSLIEDPERIALLEENIGKLALRDAAQTIADEIYKILG